MSQLPCFRALTETEIAATEKERLRLAQSAGMCPHCDNEMTVGDEETAGECPDCFATEFQDDQDRRSGEPL